MDNRPGYYVTTWDAELQRFTPQAGVSPGPYSLFGLRRALRELRSMGYEVDRPNAHSVLVAREDLADVPRCSTACSTNPAEGLDVWLAGE